MARKCHLIFNEPASQYRRTSIISSISKASQDPQILQQMIMAGMNIARLNFSHDTQMFHEKSLQLLHEAAEHCSQELGRNIQIALALDTKGPEIRTGLLEAGSNAEIELKPNDNFRLSINRDLMDKGNRDFIYVDYERIIDVLLPGYLVYINDGAVELVVKELGVDCVVCQIRRGGTLGSRKKINLPGVNVDLPAVSEKDRSDLKFALKHYFDMIFASTVRNAEAVKEIRSVLGPKGKELKIIAKIDCLQSLQNIDELLSEADGILFDRADLAIEIPPAKIFLAQKAIAELCNKAGKPIIIASQLLASMCKKPTPTRSEVADLGNAILDGADCVMLSAETAIGKYPVESVAMMDGIVREFELALRRGNGVIDIPLTLDPVNTVAISAVNAANKTKASAIIVLTTSGRSAHLLAKYHPKCPILAVTRCSRSFRQCFLYRGIVPILYTEKLDDNWLEGVDVRIQYALNIAKRIGIVKTGDTILIVSPWKDGAGFTNNLRLIYAYFEQDDIDCMVQGDRKSTKKSIL
ncbi:pyruvate kinase-like [Musca domestica]|uniref:Pyruvate kinase n=1 Tax=Musca domestica TaxID=7370 RepID=A0ABM3UV59_MUSDO|nr:pyruvate kinase-like [Musca domestica]